MKRYSYEEVLEQCVGLINECVEMDGRLPVPYGELTAFCYNTPPVTQFIRNHTDGMTEEQQVEFSEQLDKDILTAVLGVEKATRIIIGERIAQLRYDKGLTQAQLAELCGMKQQNIARIEAGTHSTGVDVLSRIADVLGTKLDL